VASAGFVLIRALGSPDGEASVRCQEIDTSLGVSEDIARTADLELHEALPPVVYSTCGLRKHAAHNLQAK